MGEGLSRREFFRGRRVEKVSDNETASRTADRERALVLKRDIIREVFELNGSQVTIIGVSHVPNTFDAVPDFWEQEIERSEAVLLEGAPVLEKNDHEAAIAALIDYLRSAGSSEREIEWVVQMQSHGQGFFRRLDLLVQRKKRPVAIGDPRKGMSKIAEKMESLDENVQLAKNISFFGGISLGAGIFILQAIRTMQGLKESTRREMFKLLGGALLAGVGTAAGVSAKISSKADSYGDVVRREGKNALEPLLFQLEDFRDVCAGKTLEILTRKYKKITVVYGKDHFRAIRQYAERSQEASAKLAAYRATYGWIEAPSVRMYMPPEQGETSYRKIETSL